MKKITNFLKNIEYKYFLLPTSIILLILSIVLNGEQLIYISNDTLIITFIGIIATFIVISNFSQVSEIKNDFNQKINEQNKDFSDKVAKIDEKIVEIDKIFDELNLIKEEIEKKNWYNLAEIYRLFGFINTDNVKSSTFYYIDSLVMFLKYFSVVESSKEKKDFINKLFNVIKRSINEPNWEYSVDDSNTFNSIIKKLTEIQTQDKRIPDLIKSIELKRDEVQANLIKKKNK